MCMAVRRASTGRNGNVSYKMGFFSIKLSRDDVCRYWKSINNKKRNIT